MFGTAVTLFAIRNCCEGNTKVQEYISSLNAIGIEGDQSELTRLGLEAKLDDQGRMTLESV